MKTWDLRKHEGGFWESRGEWRSPQSDIPPAGVVRNRGISKLATSNSLNSYSGVFLAKGIFN
jgi:hypothetical protein